MPLADLASGDSGVRRVSMNAKGRPQVCLLFLRVAIALVGAISEEARRQKQNRLNQGEHAAHRDTHESKRQQ
jgi:hypothetical protein